jgi:hypothetical protein
MGVDQHRAQISAEWIDTITGEVSRARVAPADRAGVRKFVAGFRGKGLEVALEATTGWRFVVEELERSAGAVVDRSAAGIVDPARAHPGSQSEGPRPAYAVPAAHGVAAADAGGALSPRVPATPGPADAGEARVAGQSAAPRVAPTMDDLSERSALERRRAGPRVGAIQTQVDVVSAVWTAQCGADRLAAWVAGFAL